MKPKGWIKHQAWLTHVSHKSPSTVLTPVDTLALLLETGDQLLAEDGTVLDTES